MKLSIIVPYDRYINYLYDCLESISQQQIKDYETLLIISDENQITDDLKKYDINLKIINAGIDANVAKKRNIGIDNATGDYLYFIDCDDYLMKDTLSLLLEKATNNDLDLVSGIRKFTWFKKKVFETMDDEKNDELDLKDKDHDRKNKFINKVYDETNSSEYKTDILIRTRHGLRNISVLNILIKNQYEISTTPIKFHHMTKVCFFDRQSFRLLYHADIISMLSKRFLGRLEHRKTGFYDPADKMDHFLFAVLVIALHNDMHQTV